MANKPKKPATGLEFLTVACVVLLSGSIYLFVQSAVILFNKL